MTTVAVEIRVLAEAGWRIVRDARLTALRDAPHAFLSSHQNELMWDEEVWRRTFEAAWWIVAVSDGTTVGLLRAVTDPDDPTTRQVDSVWVDPRHRRRGVLRRMMRFLVERSSRDGVVELRLWVVETNRAAVRAYWTLGFVPTGRRQPLPGVPVRHECEFRVVLTPS